MIKDKKFKNREMLLQAALEEFSHYSFEMASLNRIIKESATSKGAFYYHFDNKEDLYGQLLQMGLEAKWQFINDFTQSKEADFSEMDLFDKFLYQAEAGLVFARQYPLYNKLGMMFSKEKGTEIYEKTMKKFNADGGDRLSLMITEAYQAGEIDEGYSKAFVTALITHLFESFDDIFSLEEDMEKDLENLKAYVGFMRLGLKRK